MSCVPERVLFARCLQTTYLLITTIDFAYRPKGIRSMTRFAKSRKQTIKDLLWYSSMLKIKVKCLLLYLRTSQIH